MQTEVKNLKCGGRRFSILESLILISIFILMASGKPPEALHVSKGMERNAFRMGSDNNVSSKNESDICVSVQCYSAATKVLSKIKWEIEPCDDFYQFVCGKFIEEVVIPKDKVKMNTFSMISDRVTDQLKRIIVEERPHTDPKHLRFPNIFYKACMNTTLEDLGAAPIKQISDALGGWPLIVGDAWDSGDKWNWQDTAKKLRKLGFPKEGIFTTSLNVDWRNNTVWILSIDEPGLDLDREFLVKGFSGKRVRDYYDYMVDIAVLFGADKEKAKNELRTVIEFEIRLANISTTFTDQNSSSDIMDVHSIKQLQKLYPYVQWLDYINALLPEGLLVDGNEPINMMIPNFFDSLGILLAKTPKRVIANYMLWQMHDFAVPFLSEEFRNRDQQYQTLTSGVQSREPRWKECVDITSASFGISVGSLYVQEYFRGDSKAITLEMVNNIRPAFEDILNEVAWMDDITKQEALKKLHSMVAHVGYPDELLDKSKLEEYYRKLEIDPLKYFESLLKVNSFNIGNMFNKLRVPVNKFDWQLHSMPTTVNAFYSSTENSLIIPAAILQGNFFNANLPMYMNYGGIGVTIGHEITHGFDNEGQKYDKNGNLVDWWQSDTQEAFQDRVNCIREQYGNYTNRETGLKLNAENTQADNIADNGGVKAAYTAYRKWAAANGPEAKMIGLDFTPEQMFWISAGQTWCSKYRKETLKMRITTGVHAPSEFRVLGSFSNMKDFSKDFQCSEGSPMNPVHKCEVW